MLTIKGFVSIAVCVRLIEIFLKCCPTVKTHFKFKSWFLFSQTFIKSTVKFSLVVWINSSRHIGKRRLNHLNFSRRVFKFHETVMKGLLIRPTDCVNLKISALTISDRCSITTTNKLEYCPNWIVNKIQNYNN